MIDTVLNALGSAVDYLKPLCARAFVIISFALWIPAAIFFDRLSQGKSKRRRILYGIIFVLLVCIWFIGQDGYYNMR